MLIPGSLPFDLIDLPTVIWPTLEALLEHFLGQYVLGPIDTFTGIESPHHIQTAFAQGQEFFNGRIPARVIGSLIKRHPVKKNTFP